MVIISAMVLVCLWEIIVRLRIFLFWDGYCNNLFGRDVYKSKVIYLSSLSLVLDQSSMVNVFGNSIASGPGNLQVAKKDVVTVGKFKDYIDEIQQSYELGFTP